MPKPKKKTSLSVFKAAKDITSRPAKINQAVAKTTAPAKQGAKKVKAKRPPVPASSFAPRKGKKKKHHGAPFGPKKK